jgi:hypothetical protein
MKTLLIIQCFYYFITGVWGLVHIKSFMAVTGPKTDIWLVKTVSVLIVSESLCFAAALTCPIYLPVIVLAVTSAIGLMAIDIYYPLKGRISSVYIIDAFAQLGLIVAWITVLLKIK